MNNAAKSIIAGVVLVGLGIGAAVGLETETSESCTQ